MHGIFVHFKRTLYIFVRLCRINARNMLNFQQTLRLQMLTVKKSPNRIFKKCKGNVSLLFTATSRGKRQPSNPRYFIACPPEPARRPPCRFCFLRPAPHTLRPSRSCIIRKRRTHKEKAGMPKTYRLFRPLRIPRCRPTRLR